MVFGRFLRFGVVRQLIQPITQPLTQPRQIQSLTQRFLSTSPLLLQTQSSNEPQIQTQQRKLTAIEEFNVFKDQDMKDEKTKIGGYSERGFLVNNVLINHPIVVFPNLRLIWRVKEMKEMKVEHLAIFEMIDPTPELVVIGCGKTMKPLKPEVEKYLRDLGINIEMSNSKHAIATFNVLCEEGRYVSAIIFPNEPSGV